MCVSFFIHHIGFVSDFSVFSSIFKYFVVVLSVSCRELNVILIQSESFVHLKS